jgi:hypothetical protein
MRTDRATLFVESYLYGARGHRALEQSVFAEGERRGLSERKMRRAALSIGVDTTMGCWELPALRAEALDTRSILGLQERAVSGRPLVLSGVGLDARLRRNAA